MKVPNSLKTTQNHPNQKERTVFETNEPLR